MKYELIYDVTQINICRFNFYIIVKLNNKVKYIKHKKIIYGIIYDIILFNIYF